MNGTSNFFASVGGVGAYVQWYECCCDVESCFDVVVMGYFWGVRLVLGFYGLSYKGLDLVGLRGTYSDRIEVWCSKYARVHVMAAFMCLYVGLVMVLFSDREL